MADMVKTNSDMTGINAHQARQSELGPSLPSRQNAVNRLQVPLLRTITQPRGLYEAIINTYGPITTPDVLQQEASQVDEAFNSLPASCSSDTETCSSHEDGHEIYPDRVQGRKGAPQAGRGGKGNNRGQSSRSRRRNNQAQNQSEQEWTKSILARRTGYGCLQRSQVVKYISQLEATVGESQMEVSNLSPQVILLEKHLWTLQGENESLKKQISDLSRYLLYREDQNAALQTELLDLLRIHLAGLDEQAHQQQQSIKSNAEERWHHGRDEEGEARPNLVGDEGQSQDQSSLSDDIQTTKDELGGLQLESNETSVEHADDSSRVQDPVDEKVVSTLVKWPSSLYRSVSTIRKDVLDIAITESTQP